MELNTACAIAQSDHTCVTERRDEGSRRDLTAYRFLPFGLNSASSLLTTPGSALADLGALQGGVLPVAMSSLQKQKWRTAVQVT